MTTATQTSLMNKVDELAPVLARYAADNERTRSLAEPVVDAMKAAGLFQMFTPRALGGLEATAMECYEVVERISRIDSAAGWNLQIAASTITLGALLPADGATEIMGDPDTIIAGGFNPPGAAVPVDGGYRVSGRWPFASGCQQATWLLGVVLQMGDDGQPVMTEHGPVMMVVFFPRADGSIIETWNPLGMRGTGSHDVVASDIFVPARRTAVLGPFDNPPPEFTGPLYSLGTLHPSLGNSAVALGVARADIDEAIELTRTKVPAFNQPRPFDRGVVHTALARAEAKVKAARAYYYRALEDAWASAVRGERPSPQERVQVLLAACHAAEASAEAVDLVHSAVGTSGVREEQHRFAQHFRDVHTITQHALCSAGRFESAGQVMLGRETDWPLLFL